MQKLSDAATSCSRPPLYPSCFSGKLRRFLLSTAGWALIMATYGATAGAAGEVKQIALEEQPLAIALNKIARQRGLNIIFSSKKLKGKQSNHISGAYSTAETLSRILAGTGLYYEIDDQGNIYINDQKKNRDNSGFEKISLNDDAYYQSNLVEGDEEQDKKKEEVEFEEIVVTGSHIRGAGAAGSQVFTYDRGDIDIQGYSTLPQFIQSLPQNFNGGISESTDQFSFENGAFNNISGGTGVNLRGLGNVSTLVLLNGQRLAPAGLDGSFVDVSMVPLSAIERVEVLTDGASAIYGSDAVGGVVNFKMRKDYDGAETRVRYGGATGGGLEEITIGQTFGRTWGRGYGLISYEYSHRDNLDTRDRSFTENAPVPNDLVPEQERHSFFLTGGQKLTENLEVFTTAYYSTRDSSRNNFLNTSVPAIISDGEGEQYGGTLGAALDLDSSIGNGWLAELVGNYSRSENISKSRDQDEDESENTFLTRASESLSADLNLDGALFHMPGGDAKLAVGGHFRHEKFGDVDLSVDPSMIFGGIDDSNRDVYAIFGELHLPLVSEGNRMPGVEKLEVSISGRYEEYSDFGSSTDPKFGVLWSPVEGLNLRGTYGTSFRAPLLNELDETFNSAILVNGIPNDMSPTGTSLVIQLFGDSNKNLQPETATIWTAGFDLQPVAVPGLNVSVTYFNIDYKDRIGLLTGDFPPPLNDPNFFPFIDFNGPDAAFLASLDDFGFVLNFTSFPGFGPPADFADADVIFDSIVKNLARNKTTGLDFSVSYALDMANAGSWNFSLGGTYLFEFINQALATDPVVDFVGTIENPVELRMNGGVSWSYEGFTANLTLNYVDSYEDNRVDPSVTVDSWTTTNLTISYNTEDRFDGGILDNTTFTLSAINLFDQDPPFLAALRTNTNIFFDPSAHNPNGRVLSFQITKKW